MSITGCTGHCRVVNTFIGDLMYRSAPKCVKISLPCHPLKGVFFFSFLFFSFSFPLSFYGRVGVSAEVAYAMDIMGVVGMRREA